jgi:hypothetical protein
MKLSWKPVRKGQVYCAPACGGGCTWAAHQQAWERARELCDRLGPGWKPHVWENLDWHYQAVFGKPVCEGHAGLIEVTVSHHGARSTYTVCLQTGPQIIVEAGDPVKAVELLVREMRDRAALLTSTVEQLSPVTAQPRRKKA